MFLFQLNRKFGPQAIEPAVASTITNKQRKGKHTVAAQTLLAPKETIDYNKGGDYKASSTQTFFRLAHTSVASRALNDAISRRQKALKELEAAGIDVKNARVNDYALPVEDAVNRQIQINAKFPLRYDNPDVTPIHDKIVTATSNDAEEHDKLMAVYRRYEKAVGDVVEICSKISTAYGNIEAIKNGRHMDDIYGKPSVNSDRENRYGADLAIYNDITAVVSYQPVYASAGVAGKKLIPVEEKAAKLEAALKATYIGVGSVEKMGAPAQILDLNPEPQITEFFNRKVKYTEKYLTDRIIVDPL